MARALKLVQQIIEHAAEIDDADAETEMGPSQKSTLILLKIAKLDEALHEELDEHQESEREANPIFEKSLTSALSSKAFIDCILEFAFGADLLAHVALQLLQTLAFCPALFSILGSYLQHKLPASRKAQPLHEASGIMSLLLGLLRNQHCDSVTRLAALDMVLLVAETHEYSASSSFRYLCRSRSISVLGKQLLVTPDTLPTGPTGHTRRRQDGRGWLLIRTSVLRILLRISSSRIERFGADVAAMLHRLQVTPDPTDLMEVAHPGGEELYKLYSRLLREVLRSQKCTLAPPPPPMPPI